MLPLFWLWKIWGTSRLTNALTRKAVRKGSPLIQGSVKVMSNRPPNWP